MQKQKSIRVFENDFLERLTHVHPITPLVLWLPVISWLFYRSFVSHELSWQVVLSFAVSGFVFWTLAEYLLHRFVFHFQPEGKFQERIQFLIHGLHHDDPQDATRLVMPPVPAIILGVALFALFRMLLGPVWVEPFFAAFLVGYLCYDYIHFYVHHFNPTTRFGKMLKQHHMLHHFVTHDARWGVSSPIWDYFFGTLEEHKKERSTA